MEVYKAIGRVQAALAREGIKKDKEAKDGPKFAFRGIDDIYNAMATLLAENGLCIMPRIVSRETVSRERSGKDPLHFAIVKAEYDFISTADGSKHTVEVWGEAMDSGDKGTSKAQSAAYKYACLQTFCIPTEGDPAVEEEKLRKQEQERLEMVIGMEAEIAAALDKVRDAASYATAREVVTPIYVRLKSLAPDKAAEYGKQMAELKEKHLGPAPRTVESALGARS